MLYGGLWFSRANIQDRGRAAPRGGASLAWSRCHRRRAFLSPAPVPNGVAATLQTRVSPQ